MQNKYMYNRKVYPKPENSTRKQNLYQCDKIRGKNHGNHAKTQDFRHYIIRSLAEKKLDIVVIHIGGNNINFKNAENLNVENLAENIVNMDKQFNV